MLLHQIAGTFLSCILFAQLISLTALPTISINTYSYGRTEEASFIAPAAPAKPAPLAAAFTAATKNYDALLFVGDVLLARNVEYLMEQHGPSYPYQGIDFAAFSVNPAVIGNFESAIPQTHVPTPENMITFSVSETYLQAARDAGFTHFSLANNHSNDFGTTNLLHTRQTLRQYGFASLGDPTQLLSTHVSYLETAVGTVAIIGVHALENEYDTQDFARIISKATEHSELQIVYVHWGTEYAKTNSKAQQETAARMVTAGADLIVGHHPHVVQNIERIDGVLVFYSLGNYIFDQYFSPDVEEGLLLYVEANESPYIHLIPVTSSNSLSQPHMMTPDAYTAFLKELASHSDSLLAAQIMQGRIPLFLPVATSTKVAMMSW